MNITGKTGSTHWMSDTELEKLIGARWRDDFDISRMDYTTGGRRDWRVRDANIWLVENNVHGIKMIDVHDSKDNDELDWRVYYL